MTHDGCAVPLPLLIGSCVEQVGQGFLCARPGDFEFGEVGAALLWVIGALQGLRQRGFEASGGGLQFDKADGAGPPFEGVRLLARFGQVGQCQPGLYFVDDAGVALAEHVQKTVEHFSITVHPSQRQRQIKDQGRRRSDWRRR